jgi:hypothetical protein
VQTAFFYPNAKKEISRHTPQTAVKRQK